jgi:hypothetical protein
MADFEKISGDQGKVKQVRGAWVLLQRLVAGMCGGSEIFFPLRSNL